MGTHIRHYEMTPADNVLYFPNNIDVRLCPKNGMSSIKELYRIYRGHNEYVGRKYRMDSVKNHSCQFEMPFRKNSYRIAVKRDPVDRFKSACEYILANQAKYIKSGRLNELPSLDEELDTVLDKIEGGLFKNNHFYTQSWYMNSTHDYNLIVHIDELSQLMVFLNESSGLGLSPDQLDIWDNKTSLKMYGDVLTEQQIRRIKKLYWRDYESGWCKNEY
jgi:hypothetical protein